MVRALIIIFNKKKKCQVYKTAILILLAILVAIALYYIIRGIGNAFMPK